MRTRRKGRWLLKQPRLGARMCQGTFFFKDNGMLVERAFYCFSILIPSRNPCRPNIRKHAALPSA